MEELSQGNRRRLPENKTEGFSKGIQKAILQGMQGKSS